MQAKLMLHMYDDRTIYYRCDCFLQYRNPLKFMSTLGTR